MALKIDDQLVDTRILSAWREALADCAGADLQRFAGEQPQLTAGFRKGKVSTQVLLARIRALLQQAGELPADLRDLLRSCTLSDPLLRHLSEASLETWSAALADALGRLKLYAALLLDERASMRQLGFTQLAQWDGTEPTEADSAAAWTRLRQALGPMLAQLQCLAGADEPPKAVVPDPQTVRPTERRQPQLVLNLRQKRQEANRLRRELQAANAERDRAVSQAEALGSALATSQAALRAKALAHAELEAQLDDRVAQALARQLDARLLPWLQPAEALAQAVTAAPGADARAQAQAVLQQQAQLDRKFGLRSELAAERIQCQELCQRLEDARRESLNPLPGIAPALDALTRRMTAIDTLLKHTSATHGQAAEVPAPLRERLETARTLEQLTELRNSLQAVASTGLLTPAQLGASYALLTGLSSRLYLQTRLGDHRASVDVSLRGLPLYALQSRLAQDLPCTLLIDGHNVLYQLPMLFGRAFEQGQPGLQAQQALIERLHALSLLQPQLSLELWFDSTSARDVTHSAQLRVHYSGGQGTDRADDQIVAYLHYLSRSPQRPFCALVTADREEASRAEACGTLILSPQELALLLPR